MRWPSQKILRIIGLTLIGAAPFVIAFLLLPNDENAESGASPSPSASVDPSATTPLSFPFASPSDFPTLVTEPSPTASLPIRQCNNGRDDDKDGKIDLADRGCSSRIDNSEAPDPSPAATPSPGPSSAPSPEPPTSNCDDNFDNDGDSLPDGADPGCADDGNELPFNEPGPSRTSCEIPGVPGCPVTTRPPTTKPPTTPTTQPPTEPPATTSPPDTTTGPTA